MGSAASQLEVPIEFKYLSQKDQAICESSFVLLKKEGKSDQEALKETITTARIRIGISWTDKIRNLRVK